MKAYTCLLYTIALTIGFTLFGSSESYCSQSNSENNAVCYTVSDPETIQMQKIAFYTAELKLTPKEAEKFWPLYNEYWEARMSAHIEAMKALKQLKDVLEEYPSTATDTEIKRLSDEYLANYANEANLMKEYFVKFQKVLPIKKAARIFNTEEKFRRLLIKQLRKPEKPTSSN